MSVTYITVLAQRALRGAMRTSSSSELSNEETESLIEEHVSEKITDKEKQTLKLVFGLAGVALVIGMPLIALLL